MAFVLAAGRYFGSAAVNAAALQHSLAWLTCALGVLRLPEAQGGLPVKRDEFKIRDSTPI